MNTDNLTQAQSDPSFQISRVFDAPRDLVWKAYTEAERLAQWWGPKDFKTRVLQLDFRPGGVFHYAMETPQGEIYGKFVYREIVPQERLVFLISFADAQGNTVRAPFSATWPLENISIVTFADEDGKTRLTMDGHTWNTTDEEKATFAGGLESVRGGTNGTLDQLVEYLSTVTA